MRHRRPSRTSPLLDARAIRMRGAPTASEAALARALAGGKLGCRFRRQYPLLGRFIADFYAPAAKLVVEVDGPSHTGRAKADARRDRSLARAFGCSGSPMSSCFAISSARLRSFARRSPPRRELRIARSASIASLRAPARH